MMTSLALLVAVVSVLPFAKEEMDLHLKLAEAKVDYEITEDVALHPEECRVTIKDGKVRIVGGKERGALYGVYSFLERELGIRWYEQWSGPHVPKKGTPALADKTWTEEPVLAYRGDCWPVRAAAKDNGCALFFIRNRRNFDNHGSNGFGKDFRERIPQCLYMLNPGCHTHFYYLPPKKNGYTMWKDRGYFAEHPEWYSLRNGKRVADYQLCLSNAEMREEYYRNLCEHIRQNDGKGLYTSSLMDVPGEICSCEKCRALAREYGCVGGPAFDFACYLGNRLLKDFPDVRLFFDQYRREQTQFPPTKKVDWPSNLFGRFCPIDSDFSKDFSGKRNRGDMKDFAGWCRQVKMFAWYYPYSYGRPLTAGFRRTVNDTRYMARAGLVGGNYEHDVGTVVGQSFAEAMWWVMYQAYRDPSRDWRSLRDEWFDWAYGPASSEMKSFSDAMEAHFEVREDNLKWDACGIDFPAARLVLEFDPLFDRAEAKVLDDATRLQRVREARLGLDWMLLAKARNVRKIARRFDFDKVKARALDTNAKATALRKTEPGIRAKIEELAFVASVNPKPLPKMFEGIDEDRIVQVFPQSKSKAYTAYVDDPDAAIDKALCETGSKYDPSKGGYPVFFWDKAAGKQLQGPQDKIPNDQIEVGHYKYYRIFSGMKMPSASCQAIIGPIWWVTASAADCWKPGVDERWDVWAELKFAKDGRVWFSRAVFVRQ